MSAVGAGIEDGPGEAAVEAPVAEAAVDDVVVGYEEVLRQKGWWGGGFRS